MQVQVQTPPPNLAPEQGIDDFKKEIAEPAKPAVDSTAPPLQDGGGAPEFSDEPLGERTQPSQPVFTEEIPATPAKDISDKDAKDDAELFLVCRNILQAELFAMIAGSKNPKEYELDEQQLDRLTRVWVPYVKKWGNKIPDWLWLVMVEGITTGKMAVKAAKNGWINYQNKKQRDNPQVKDQIARAAASTGKGTRTRWTIKKDGTYKFDRNGEYVKVDDPKEKADIKDLKTLLEYNNVDLVCSVFNIDRDFIASQGITLDEE